MALGLSRYGSQSGSPTGTTVTTSPSASTTSSSSSGNQDTTSQSQSTTNESSQTNTQVQNMDADSLAALELLIQQLLGGGTQQMAQDRATRLQEVQANQGLRSGYTKEAAFADAQGAMAQLLQQSMEKSMPALVRAAEGAGASQNSMRALLTQDALTRASQGAATLGLEAAGNYGSIAQGFSQVLEALTRPDTTVSDALLQALNTAKGAITNTQSSSVGTSTTNQSGSSNTNTSNQNTSTQQNSGNTVTTRPNPYGDVQYTTTGGGQSLIGISGSDSDSGGSYFGSNVTPQELAMSLLGGNGGWDDYSF